MRILKVSKDQELETFLQNLKNNIDMLQKNIDSAKTGQSKMTKKWIISLQTEHKRLEEIFNLASFDLNS